MTIKIPTVVAIVAFLAAVAFVSGGIAWLFGAPAWAIGLAAALVTGIVGAAGWFVLGSIHVQ